VLSILEGMLKVPILTIKYNEKLDISAVFSNYKGRLLFSEDISDFDAFLENIGEICSFRVSGILDDKLLVQNPGNHITFIATFT